MNLRVRFAETDQMGVAHHSAYVVWLEAARIEWLRDRGLDYRRLEEAGVALAVSALSVQYLKSSRFDDELTIDAEMTELRSRRARFRYVIRRGTERIATADTLHTPVTPAGRATRLPGEWLGRLQDEVVNP